MFAPRVQSGPLAAADILPGVPGRTEAIGGHRAGPRSVGIVGAGQLARMLAEAASILGIDVAVLAERPDAAAALMSANVLIGAPREARALNALAARSDVVTFDHEQVDLRLVADLEAGGVVVRPGVRTLEMAVDKAVMRTRLAGAGIPVPAFALLPDPHGPQAAKSMTEAVVGFAAAHGWPVVLKAVRGGYDGKGVWVVADVDETTAVCETAASDGSALLVEEHVTLDAELAVLVARRPSGETVVWPAVETAQIGGVCREVLVPGRLGAEVVSAASELARAVSAEVESVGVLAVEMFWAAGRLSVNEIAARPHNSGHWTIEGAETSQFENHLRAVLDLPLGTTAPRAPQVASVNVFGSDDGADPIEGLARALAIEGAHVHLYGKQAHGGRKLGHVTVCGEQAEDVRGRAWAAALALGTPQPSELARPAGSG
jgi:5-(carboxyamino)imidazole ribonucleotide synthase